MIKAVSVVLSQWVGRSMKNYTTILGWMQLWLASYIHDVLGNV